jgi:mannose-6-phosphate isomerase-like protein (cupin superfamily)
MQLPQQRTVVAPDGSVVRVLLGLAGGAMAHFELGPGQVSAAVVHLTVEEVWFVLAGEGQMWRKQGEREEITTLLPGVCITIPLGTQFQFRSSSHSALSAVAVTMPPWPGEGEAIATQGPWQATGGQPQATSRAA